jgi:hypothetical protein
MSYPDCAPILTLGTRIAEKDKCNPWVLLALITNKYSNLGCA